MRYAVEHVYEAPIELVVEGLLEIGVYDIQDLENVQASKPLEERDDGECKHMVNEWNVHGQIPKVAQKIIQPHMLTFIERAVWNRKTREYAYTVEPHYFKKTILAGGVTSFRKKDENRTIRRVDAHLTIKLPLIGGLLESWIIEHLKKNEQQDFEISSRALYAWLEREGRR